MTKEKARVARENIKKYPWAREEVREKYISRAERYVDKIDLLYDMVIGEGIPRSTCVGAEGDPYTCSGVGGGWLAEPCAEGRGVWDASPPAHEPCLDAWSYQGRSSFRIISVSLKICKAGGGGGVSGPGSESPDHLAPPGDLATSLSFSTPRVCTPRMYTHLSQSPAPGLT